jgi:YtkA-like
LGCFLEGPGLTTGAFFHLLCVSADAAEPGGKTLRWSVGHDAPLVVFFFAIPRCRAALFDWRAQVFIAAASSLRGADHAFEGVEIMIFRITLAVAFLLSAASLADTAFAGADDYVFEPVKSEVKSSNVAMVAVRLVHKPTGKPIADATIVHTRLDMTPDGMAMTTVVAALPSPAPGVYAFKAPLTMAGRWLLTISGKVEGEPELVTGKIIFKVTP